MAERMLSSKELVGLSMKMSKVLRHNAIKMGFRMGSDGYVSVDELLSNQMFRGYTIKDIMRVVDNNDKKRFEVSEQHGRLMIRAVQGHTISSISDAELLTEIVDASEVPVCIHGTYKHCLPLILDGGLNRMKRNHIHMAAGMPGEGEVISGMRKSCEVIVYVDVAAAMAAGVKFFRANNGVILTAGLNDSGVLPAEFIERIVER
jgi:2'-phosphotransferase